MHIQAQQRQTSLAASMFSGTQQRLLNVHKIPLSSFSSSFVSHPKTRHTASLTILKRPGQKQCLKTELIQRSLEYKLLITNRVFKTDAPITVIYYLNLTCLFIKSAVYKVKQIRASDISITNSMLKPAAPQNSTLINTACSCFMTGY